MRSRTQSLCLSGCLVLSGFLLQLRPCMADVITAINPHNAMGTYQIEPGGLLPGALVYTDRTYQWAVIPPFLLGADYVETANNDKINAAFSIDVTLSEEAFLYVFHDERVPPPSWLGSMFEDTGAEIISDELGTPRPFSVFRREVGPGTVTLFDNGSNTNNSSMYGIAATAIPEPGSLALIGVAAFAILGYCRLRRRE